MYGVFLLINVKSYALLLKGVGEVEAFLAATKDISPERLALIAGADFEPATRVEVIKAHHVNTLTVNLFSKLLEDVITARLARRILDVSQEVSVERLEIIACAGFSDSMRCRVLRAKQITSQNARHYAQLLRSAHYNVDLILDAAQHVSDEKIALIAGADLNEQQRMKVLSIADKITQDNIAHYALLLRHVQNVDALLTVATSVSDERLRRSQQTAHN